MYLVTKDGTRYLDMFAGIAVSALGHSHPGILGAIGEQSRKYLHLSNYFVQAPQVDLARRLLQASGFERVFFANSGSEATEGALKISRKWGSAEGKRTVIAFSGSFHGRTYGAMSLMDRQSYRDGFGPFLDDCTIIPFNEVGSLRSTVTPETAAVILECIQGEGGIRPVDMALITELCSLRDRFGFLIIVDEIQSGLGRTGRLFAYEHYGFRPDMALVAKPLGGGLPLGAVLGGPRVAGVLGPGTHGSTFGGNALACAAGIVVMRELTERGLLKNVRAMGETLRTGLVRLRDSYPALLKDVRGSGLMLGVEATGEAGWIAEKLRERKVLVNVTNRTVLRIVPALNIQVEHVREFLRAFEDVLSARS
jgi:acetylornithine/succinyldiaminopimelate/putrescine aminotransferase